ncbi:MAG: response regulator [Vicinamibacterales bacterium]
MAAASPQPVNSQVHCLVLMLDDHEDTREMYATCLTLDGHFTVESNVLSTEAFDWVLRAQPDVVVTDYRMPGLNGL